jgi:hypothetical protein
VRFCELICQTATVSEEDPQAVAIVALNSLSRVWVVAISAHSPFTFSRPRKRNRFSRLELLICPKTGSTTDLRSAQIAWPGLDLSLRSIRPLASRSFGGLPRDGLGRWLCCWRLVLVGLVIDGHSDGHGVTPIDLSTKPGQPHAVLPDRLVMQLRLY